MAWTKIQTSIVTGVAVLVAVGTATLTIERMHPVPAWKLRQPQHSNNFQDVGRKTPKAAAETVLWAAFNNA